MPHFGWGMSNLVYLAPWKQENEEMGTEANYNILFCVR